MRLPWQEWTPAIRRQSIMLRYKQMHAHNRTGNFPTVRTETELYCGTNKKEAVPLEKVMKIFR